MHATADGNVTPTRAVSTKITETEIIHGILRKRDRRVDDTSHAESRGRDTGNKSNGLLTKMRARGGK